MPEVDDRPIEEIAREIVGGTRHQDYGSYERESKRIAAGWSLLIGTPIKERHVPLMMIWLKMCREEHSHKRDNFVDIVGYSILAEEGTVAKGEPGA